MESHASPLTSVLKQCIRTKQILFLEHELREARARPEAARREIHAIPAPEIYTTYYIARSLGPTASCKMNNGQTEDEPNEELHQNKTRSLLAGGKGGCGGSWVARGRLC